MHGIDFSGGGNVGGGGGYIKIPVCEKDNDNITIIKMVIL